MKHTDIYKEFQKLFPSFVEHTEVWFQNGYGSIRIRWANKKEFIFTYADSNHWRLETVFFETEKSPSSFLMSAS